MKKFEVTNDTIEEVARMITCDSFFGDEINSVSYQLAELCNSANKFGTDFCGKISDYYGGNCLVVARPNHRRHSWSF